jgi:predicted ferric reductase
MRQVLLWVGLYVVLALAPLAVALVGYTASARPFWVEFGVGLGFVAMSMMALQFVLTARFRGIAPAFGTDAMLQFHRQAGLVAAAFVAGHVVVLLLARPGYVAFFDPRVNLPRAGALVLVLLAIASLIGLTFLRKRLRLSYEWWRLTHGLLALLIMLISVAHVLMVGRYVSTFWKQSLWVALTAGAMGLLLYPRLVRPWLARRRPYKVTGVKAEGPKVWTLELEADGHEGLRFVPGQFVWLTLGDTPFTLQQHPFTIASSAARAGRYSFTIKELGDFTSRIGSTKADSRAWLEGPFGGLRVSPEAEAVVLIAGGIGITPMMSILRTMRDTGDTRPVTLVYGAPDADGLIFADELAAMPEHVRFVPVLENPGPGWDGERGLIDAALLERVLAPDTPATDYVVCGPPPMMDEAERALMARGVPVRRRHAERFDIA